MNIIFRARDFSSNTLQAPHMRAVKVDSYSHNAIGGPKRARLTAPVGIDPERYFDLLRYPVYIYHEARPVWWGYVHAVRIPGVSVTLDSVYNVIRVHYGVLPAGAVAVSGSAETDWASDWVSQSELGIMEYITEMEKADSATAEARRDLFLSQHSRPILAPDSGSGGVQIECRGWWDALDWEGEEQISAAGAIIQAVIGDGGIDYDVGDVVDVDGGTGGQVTITSVDDDPTEGVVTGFSLTAQGSGYSAGVTTTTHTAGSGLTLDIIAATGLSIDWTDLAKGILRDGYSQFVTNGQITSGGQGIPACWDWIPYKRLFETWMQLGYTDGRRGLSYVNSDLTCDLYPEPAEAVTYSLDREGNLRDANNRIVAPEKCTTGAWATLRTSANVAGGIAVTKPWFIEEAEYNAASRQTRYRAANVPDPFKLTEIR
jgi:hypothetical protein